VRQIERDPTNLVALESFMRSLARYLKADAS